MKGLKPRYSLIISANQHLIGDFSALIFKLCMDDALCIISNALKTAVLVWFESIKFCSHKRCELGHLESEKLN
jgi:hypothetical protein